eukprot:10165066-Ditylum_brightwellii.AAC.1
MQLYRLDMKHTDQERMQREEKIEKHEHDRECFHQELIIELIVSIMGKQSIDDVLNTTNTPLDILEYQEVGFKMTQEEQDTLKKKHSFTKGNSKDNSKDISKDNV